MEIYRQNNNEVEFYPHNLAKLFIKKIWIILLCIVIGGGATYSYTYFFVQKQYSTSVTLYVNNSTLTNNNETITSNDLSVAQSLVDAYTVIISSNTVMQQVIDQSGENLTIPELVNMIRVEAQSGTSLFKVYVTNTSPIEATNIANTIASVVTEQMPKIIEGSSVQIVDEARVPEYSVSPNYKVSAMIGMLVGLFISVSIIFTNLQSFTLVFYLNRRLHISTCVCRIWNPNISISNIYDNLFYF